MRRIDRLAGFIFAMFVIACATFGLPAAAEHVLESLPLASSDIGFVSIDSFVRASDRLYIAGGFFDEVDFNPNGPESLWTSTCPETYGCSFVAAYDADMQLVWFDLFYGTGESYDRLLVPRTDGSVYLLLDFSGGLACVPGATDPCFQVFDTSDIATIALGSDGTFAGGAQLSTGGTSSLRSAHAYESATDTVDFVSMRLDDPEALGTDAFVARLDVANASASILTTLEATDDGNSIAVIEDQRADATGRYLCGEFRGTVDFDARYAHRVVETAQANGFVARYDAGGALVRLSTMSADTGSSCDGIVVSPDGTVWATGGFGGHAFVQSDGNPVPAELMSLGFADSWLLAWDGLGVLRTNAHLGGPQTSAFPNRIEAFDDGTLAITGTFIGQLTNGFASTLARASNSDYGDAFVIVVANNLATQYFGQIGFDDGYTFLTPTQAAGSMQLEAIAQMATPLGGNSYLDYALPPEHALLHDDGTWASAYVRYDLDTMLANGFDSP